MIGKKMKRLCSLFIFLVVFLSFGTSGLAKSSISWGEIKQADYDTSIPGTPLLWSDPLSQGGMNLKTGTMTGGKDADVVFSSDGMQIGANEIADLGKVEFDRVNQTPAFGLAWLINAVPGNVYIIKCKDGTLAKLKIIRNSGSVVTFHYALEKLSDDQPGQPPQVTSIAFKETLQYSPTPVTLPVIANYRDNTKATVKGEAVEWESNNRNVATVNPKGMITFTGKPGKVTITATYKGKKASATITVPNMVKQLTTTTKLTYSKSPVKIPLTAVYMDGKKVKVTSGAVWKSSNTKVAKVNAAGVVTFTGKGGNVTITATYKGQKLTLKTTVVPQVTSITFNKTLKYSPTPVSLAVIANYSDKTKATVKAGSVKWTSNNKKVATVNGKGKVAFTGKPGKVTITATYKGKKASATITVPNMVKQLTTTTKLTYSKKPIKIPVTAVYMNGKKVKLKSGLTWKSSNKKVATVNSAGVVTFTGKNGSVTITATYKGKKLALKTTVKRVDPYYGKWKLWIPGAMVDYYYKGGYAGSKYSNGAYSGSLTINKNGTYDLNGKKGKWRVAKNGEVFNHPTSIILLQASGKYDIAVTAHDRKKGYIKLMTDSKGKYTDGSKIWIFSAEGYK